jgi:stage IV sporulation protein FB
MQAPVVPKPAPVVAQPIAPPSAMVPAQPAPPTVAQPTGLSFRLFGIPVRFNLSFLLVAAVFMYGPGRSISSILMLMGILAISVLVHEFGHALAFKLYGLESEISLMGFMGLTAPNSSRQLTNTEMLVVSGAGPAAGLLLAAFAYMIRDTFFHSAFNHPLDLVVMVNVWINLLNLVPIFPLDGGRIMKSLLELASPSYGEKAAYAVSLVAAGIAIMYAVNNDFQITAIFLLGFAGLNFTALRTKGSLTPSR